MKIKSTKRITARDCVPPEEPSGDPDYNPNRDQDSYERAAEEKRRLS